MKRRKVKTERQKLVLKLDKLAKHLVYVRDNWTCQRCGKHDGMDYQASHVIPVSGGNKLRWDLLNMKVLCYHDHLNWWHKNPMEASAWFAETFPERWAYLQAERGIRKFSIVELREMVQAYEVMVQAAN